jgi:hypothetical protein
LVSGLLNVAATIVGAAGTVATTVEAAVKGGAKNNRLLAIDKALSSTPVGPALSVLDGSINAAQAIDDGDDWLTAIGRAVARGVGQTAGTAAGVAACGELGLDTFGAGWLACPAITLETSNVGGDFVADTFSRVFGYTPKEVADWQAQNPTSGIAERPPQNTEWNLARHGQSSVSLVGDLWGATTPGPEEIYHSFYVNGDRGFFTPHVSEATARRLADAETNRAATAAELAEVAAHQSSERSDAEADAARAQEQRFVDQFAAHAASEHSDDVSSPTSDPSHSNEDQPKSDVQQDEGTIDTSAHASQPADGSDATVPDLSGFVPEFDDSIAA